MVAAIKRGSGEPTDLTISHLAGKIAKKKVKNSVPLLSAYWLMNLLKKYNARTLDAKVTKSIE